MPVRFDCHSCREPWWSPPANGCPRCGYGTPATPDPVIWEVGRIPGTNVFLSGQMRDPRRFDMLVGRGFEVFVDVAGDAPYVWRPSRPEVEAAAVAYTRVRGVEDTNVDLPDCAFAAVAEAVDLSFPDLRRLLVFCAAGLKRAPHLLYGALLGRGYGRAEAWNAVSDARPFAERFPPYIRAAERWVAAA